MSARRMVLMMAAALAATGVMAADPEVAPTNQTVITSTRLDYDNARRTAVFEGNVVVTDARVTIKADQITALFNADNQPEMITAVGNVRIDQEDRQATCERASYSLKSGLLVLTGRPVVKRGTEVMSGSRIIFSRDDDKIKCEDAVLRFTSGQGGLDTLMKR